MCLRAPVSESLSRLQRDQLQKFAQYLISELPQQVSGDHHLTDNLLNAVIFTLGQFMRCLLLQNNQLCYSVVSCWEGIQFLLFSVLLFYYLTILYCQVKD